MKSLFAAMVLFACLRAQGPASDPAGDWAGTVQLPGMELAVQVHLEGGMAWSGRISIPAQGARDLPLEAVTVAGDSLSFRIAGVPGAPTFTAKAAGDGFQGSLSQNGASFPFAMKRPVAESGLPAGLRERELTAGSAALPLPATLTLPAGKGPWPVLVLVHGSGPHDRDERIGSSTPFRDLAWGLAARGVAVLRYDKRTLVHKLQSAPDMDQLTVREEVVADAAAAVALARTLPEADPAKVFLLGHSLGGMLVPRIAKAAPGAAGFVILAGATRPLEDLVLEQVRRQGAPPEKLKEVEDLVARIKALDPARPSKETILFAPAAYWLDLRGYRPAQEAKAIAAPMLILQGDKDCQVTLDDYALWQAALGTRKDVRFKRFPKLNHLFMAVEGVSNGSEYFLPGQHVDPEVVKEIADWICGPRG